MLKKGFFVLLSVLLGALSNHVYAQMPSSDAQRQMAKTEDSLIVIADSMYNAFIPDMRPEYCQKFVKMLVRSLRTPNSYGYPYTNLKKKINIIGPSDDQFRIFNWLVVGADNKVRYYGAIQRPSEALKLYPLVDYTLELGKYAEDSVLSGSKWFGALYYRIISTEARGGQRYYTLFGLNASGLVSNKKVLEPMQLTEDGVVFGAPIFNVSSDNTHQRVNRFIIEYKKEVNASLNWDDETKMIYFDKLISQVNDPNRKYTYVPSGQYDGFRWDVSQWSYIQDLIPVQNFKDGEAPAPKPIKGKE